MPINKEAPVQLHYQLTTELRNSIESGNWSIGDLFPTDREIMERYKVSGTTVRRAVKQLVEEGWLERTPGKGTFITKEPIREDLGRLTGFFEEMRSKGLHPSAEVLSAELVEITAQMKKQVPSLRAWPETQAVLFQKVHKIDGKPIVFVSSFWKKEYGAPLQAFDLAAEGLYEAASRHLRLNLTKAEQSIYAGTATKEERALLGIKTSEPALLMERTAYAGEELVEVSRNVYRADRYRYHVTLYKDQPAGTMVLVP